MIKAKPWNGKDLKGTWEVTLKIDGVRALYVKDSSLVQTGGWYSRAGKPLYNLPPWKPGMPQDCEVYLGNFKDTIRAVRTQTLKQDTPRILPQHLYPLYPIDSRLTMDPVVEPAKGWIKKKLLAALTLGYEGLVLRQGDKWLKIKPEETHDVLVTGAIEGTGKHKGRLGALITTKGKVGTGFSDEERDEYWFRFTTTPEEVIGSTIEVSCMHFTPDGMFRHPRFIRLRPDKIADE